MTTRYAFADDISAIYLAPAAFRHQCYACGAIWSAEALADVAAGEAMELASELALAQIEIAN